MHLCISGGIVLQLKIIKKSTMTEEKKDLKLVSPVSKDRDMNVELRSKNLNFKKRKRCYSLKPHQKTVVEKKAKKKHRKKTEKVSAKWDTSNVSLKYNERIYDHQIQQLNLTLKQSLNCPTLTQNELKILFMKYKLDGHYRTTKNLPPFNSLIDNTSDTINGKCHFYDEIKYSSLSNAQELNCENNKDTTENLYCNTDDEDQLTKENLHADLELNLQHKSWEPKEMIKENSVDDNIDNKYLYIEKNSIVSSNYNDTITNYDIQACNHANVFNYVQNFDQFKPSLSVNKISNTEKEQLSCNIINAQNILSEECQSYAYAGKSSFYNEPDSSIEYENFNNYSEMSQQNNIKHGTHFDDVPLNSNLYNDFHLNKWNNVSSIHKNNNVQSWKSIESVCTPYANTLESHYSVKNSVVPFQLTLIKNHSEEQNNFSSHVHTNVYHLMDSENVSYIANNSSVNIQQDFNSYYTSSSTVKSDNILPEMNTFIPSYASITDQHV